MPVDQERRSKAISAIKATLLRKKPSRTELLTLAGQKQAHRVISPSASREDNLARDHLPVTQQRSKLNRDQIKLAKDVLTTPGSNPGCASLAIV